MMSPGHLNALSRRPGPVHIFYPAFHLSEKFQKWSLEREWMQINVVQTQAVISVSLTLSHLGQVLLIIFNKAVRYKKELSQKD